MKNSISILLLALFVFGCEMEEVPDTDNIQEFAYLIDTEIIANEGANSTPETAIEINAEMLTFDPKQTDVVLSVEIIENGAKEGTDYEILSTSNSITIPAGSFYSTEGFKIRTIDNNLQAPDERQLIVRLTTINDDAINLGLGLTDVKNLETIITIAEDECPDTIERFNSATWEFVGTNTVYEDEYSGTYETTVSGDVLTISGDIANYDVGITVDGTLIPDAPGATSGTIVFDESSQGNDGTYDYRWVFNQPGIYDVCAGTMELTATIQYIDIFGPDPTAWVDWYDSSIRAVIGAEGPGGGTDCFLSSFDGRTAEVNSSFTDFNTEYFYDDYQSSFSGIGISTNEDCSVITVSGDFLDLGFLSDIQIDFIVTPDANDSNLGILSLATQELGDDGNGFDYRVRTTGVPGTFNISNGTIEVELLVDYNNSGAGYVNWYTASSSFALN